MSNTFLTATKIAPESLMLLKNSMQMGRRVHKDYQKDFGKTGQPLQIRKPNQYEVTTGATLDIQDSLEQYTTIPQPTQFHVAMAWGSAEKRMEIEDYSKRHIAPAVTKLGNHVDSLLCGLYKDVPMSVGSPGTDPNTFAIINNADTAMSDLGVPYDGNRNLVLNPGAKGSLADALKGLYYQDLTKDAVRRGDAGNLSGFDIGMSQNIKRHTMGVNAAGSTSVTNGVTTDGATSIVTDGWAVSTLVLKAGDIFTVAGVYEVNPMNKEATSQLLQFVSKTDVTSDGSGNATITVMDTTDSGPGLQDSGAYQNVSAHAADGAAIVVAQAANNRLGANTSDSGIYAQNLAFHKNAFALCMFDMDVPSAANGSMKSDPDSGVGIRCVEDYDIVNDRSILRLDILVSVKTIYPELACRVWGG